MHTRTPLEILRSLPALAGLVLVPDAVRALMAAGDTLDAAHAALEALDDAGAIELRPDAGNGEGVELCPKGPAGSIFYTLRIVG